MNNKKRPASLVEYGLWLILLMLGCFALLSMFHYQQISLQKDQFIQTQKAQARHDIKKSLIALQQNLESITDSYARWEEVRQQLANPGFYQYWRDIRIKGFNFYIDEIVNIELYDTQLNSVSNAPAFLFPTSTTPIEGSHIALEGDVVFLYVHRHVLIPFSNNKKMGSILIKFNVLPALKRLHPVDTVDMDTLEFNISAGYTGSLERLSESVNYEPQVNEKLNTLLKSYTSSIVQLGILVGIIAIVMLGVFTYLIIRPIRLIVSKIHGLTYLNEPQEVNVRFPHRELQDVWDALIRYKNELSSVHQDLNTKNDELWNLAHIDELTRCYNRRAFEEDWGHIINTIAQRRIPVAFILFDCDRFKLLNDTYGHAIGDKVLTETVNKIIMSLRTGDRLYRLGGDEFCTILVDNTAEEAMTIARRCNQELQNIDSASLGINEPVSISIGIASASGTDKINLNELQRQADTAMYYAKRPNNKNIAVYDESMLKDTMTLMNSTLTTKVYNAIVEHEGLNLLYQPIVNIHTGKPEYYEILSRLEADSEMHTPDVFLPIVQDRKLQVEFDLQVIAQIMTALSQEALPKGSGVAINLSGEGVVDDGVIANLMHLKPYLDHYKIIIEVTETSLITKLQYAVKHLNHLRDSGFLVALDDFGSGYSSLSYLTKMPIDIIKFDMSLIHTLRSTNRDAVIIRSLAEMCHKADYQVVAEGIEDQQLLELVKNSGFFTHVQGFHLGRPAREFDIFSEAS